MIARSEAIAIHEILIERFGGTKGLRDSGALESALSRPYLTFDQKELYPTPAGKAAAIFESIISNHPFLDGNKRSAYVIMRMLLMEQGADIQAKEDDKYDFVIAAASGELSFDAIKEWITNHLR